MKRKVRALNTRAKIIASLHLPLHYLSPRLLVPRNNNSLHAGSYEHKFSILDYLIDGYKIKLIQNAGIHNYLMLPSRLFGKKKVRPTYSNYFDLILEK